MPHVSAIHARARGGRQAYPELCEVLAPEYAHLPAPQLERLLEGVLGEVSPVALESFWSSVKSFAQAAAPILKQALPVVATVAGTALGGPLGGMLGGVAGKALSGAIGGGSTPGGLPGGLPVPQAGAAKAPAAAQLLQTISDPRTMQALMAMLLGGAGARQVPVGGTQVPVGAFANLVGTLAHEALSEYHQAVAGELSGIPEYLLGESGELVIEDPSDPAQRAQALLARLNAADERAAAADSEEDHRALAETWAPDDLSDLYDELDLIELYSEEN